MVTPSPSAVRIGPLPSGWARPLFAINATVAWFAVVLQVIISVSGMYPSTNTNPSLYGDPGQGFLGRLIDILSYFTILSNVVVAVVMTMLWRAPRRTAWFFRALRLDSLMMITITCIVYNALLRSTTVNVGLNVYTDLLLHQIVPVLTILVWLLVGPRRQFGLRDLLPALVVPLAWAAYALIRGAVIGAYPYDIVNVAKYGYASVLLTIATIIALGIALGLLAIGIERLLTGRR